MCTCEAEQIEAGARCAAAPAAAEPSPEPEDFKTEVYVHRGTGRRILVVGGPRQFVETGLCLGAPFGWPSMRSQPVMVYPCIREERYGWSDAMHSVELITGDEINAEYERLTWPRHG